MDPSLADIYQRFAHREVNDQSPCYREWGDGVAHDPELLGMIDELPGSKRQPQLVFAAARHVGIAPGPFKSFRTELMAQSPQRCLV